MTKTGWAVAGTATFIKTGTIVTWVAFVSIDKGVVKGVYERLANIQYDCQDDPIGTGAIKAAGINGGYTIAYSISRTIISA